MSNATPAQLNALERALAAFAERYAALKALDPAKLTPAQQKARAELLADGARIDATIRAVTGIKTSIAQTVSGWWTEARSLFDRAKGAVGLGFLPLILGATAAALMASVAAWLGSKSWDTLASTSITRSTHELAVDAYVAALKQGKSPEAAAATAATVTASLPAPSATLSDSQAGLVKFGLITLAALVGIRWVFRAPDVPPSTWRR